MELKKNILLSLCFLSLTVSSLNAEERISLEEDENSSKSMATQIKNHDVKFALEFGAQTDFWNPGLAGNVLNYDTEGIFLGFGKFKVKLYDSDVFTIEKYNTLSSSNTQDDLLAQYKSGKKQESTIDGMKVSLQLMDVLNYIFKKEWLNGLEYEYDSRDFIGTATVLQNSLYWYGKTKNAVVGEDYTLLERGNDLSFKTKFTGHKLSYRFDNVLKKVKGSYVSFGVFDEEWSKPTFVGDSGLNGELPIIFDANYYSTGISSAVGIKNSKYKLRAYLDYGVDNEMKIIQKGGNYESYNNDIDLYRWGLDADYRFSDVYSNNYLTTDILLGLGMQYNQIVEDGSIDLDAETLYSINAAIEIVF